MYIINFSPLKLNLTPILVNTFAATMQCNSGKVNVLLDCHGTRCHLRGFKTVPERTEFKILIHSTGTGLQSTSLKCMQEWYTTCCRHRTWKYKVNNTVIYYKTGKSYHRNF